MTEADLLEVGAEALVAVIDMLHQPVFQEVQQREGDRRIFIVEFVMLCLHLSHQFFMLMFVDLEPWSVRQAHQAFFEHEVGARVFAQAVEDLV